MKSASQFFRPQLLSLENRVQPGSVLLRGGLDTSLLAGTIIPLDLQDQVQDQRTPALGAPQSLTNSVETNQVALVAPLAGSLEVANPTQTLTIQDSHAAVAPDQQLQLIDHARIPHALGTVDQRNAAPIGESTGKGHITGGACEDPGNVVVDGDFETIPPPPVWFTTDPYAFIAMGGGDLTPGYHLEMGDVGTTGSVYQDVATDPSTTYNIRFSIHLDDGGPESMVIQWNGAPLVDLSGLPPSTSYTRVEILGVPSGGTGTDHFEFLEQQDPAYWHADDVCITPVLK